MEESPKDNVSQHILKTTDQRGSYTIVEIRFLWEISSK
jgi:hypothetical protein